MNHVKASDTFIFEAIKTSDVSLQHFQEWLQQRLGDVYDEGWNKGWDEGHDTGYDQGFDDGRD